MLQQCRRKIGAGGFARVYACPGKDFIRKVSLNDGTRTYIEWVIKRTLEGRRMLGMPWVETLEENACCDTYKVLMRRYVKHVFDKWEDRHHVMAVAPLYVKKLLKAFKAETGVDFNDVHSDNVMLDDDGTWVVVDPSSDDYVALPV